MSAYKSFEDLEVYKKAISFTVKIFELQKKEELKTEFALKDQLKRATLSISNNIAEGFEREMDKEFIRFLYFSKGSAGEVRNILNVMKETEVLADEEHVVLKNEIISISKQLSNYIKLSLRGMGKSQVKMFSSFSL
ncbi:four helix bundle protein [Salegentibacter sp. F188]|uniref:Four helix bundle protein n=1 Tax=Autumnicola patrickiae TaxID=3075591 RepID=A0ABU3E5A1_9FLAO|nr:four helix bundle protein [Salegentibacter sp. F188]MDT0691176.1 four helix bundle protein [Salegentibacter sp. F188]